MYMDPRLVMLFDEPRVQFPSGSESSRPQGRRTRRSRGNSRERSPLERKAPNGDVPTQAGESSQDKPTAGVVIPSTASVSSLDESDSDDSGFETTSSTSSQCDKATSSSTPSHPFDRNSTGMNVAAVTCPAQFGKCAVVTGANSGIGRSRWCCDAVCWPGLSVFWLQYILVFARHHYPTVTCLLTHHFLIILLHFFSLYARVCSTVYP